MDPAVLRAVSNSTSGSCNTLTAGQRARASNAPGSPVPRSTMGWKTEHTSRAASSTSSSPVSSVMLMIPHRNCIGTTRAAVKPAGGCHQGCSCSHTTRRPGEPVPVPVPVTGARAGAASTQRRPVRPAGACGRPAPPSGRLLPEPGCGRSRGRFCGCCPVARAWRQPRSRGRHLSAFEPPRVRCAGAAAEAPQNHPRSSSISRTRPAEVRCDAASEARLAPWCTPAPTAPRAWPGQPATAACASQHQPCPNRRADGVLGAALSTSRADVR